MFVQFSSNFSYSFFSIFAYLIIALISIIHYLYYFYDEVQKEMIRLEKRKRTRNLCVHQKLLSCETLVFIIFGMR